MVGPFTNYVYASGLPHVFFTLSMGLGCYKHSFAVTHAALQSGHTARRCSHCCRQHV